MLLSGQLSDWSVGDLLQMLHITKKTASLHIEGSDRGGAVYFDEGAVISADVTLGAGGELGSIEHIVESVYVLQLLNEGDFDVRNEVPPVTASALAVADALEQAGVHLAAERALDATGLLNARALRLAQVIEEPILLSEQVWRAISVSIPAFTFSELEQRLGRAGAVSTVEQFRDLGILEAVIEELEPQIEVEEAAAADFDAAADSTVESNEIEVAESDGQIEVEAQEPAPIVPDNDDDRGVIVVEDDGSEYALDEFLDEGTEEPAAAGVSSLTAAIRAAAAASDEAEGTSDDESVLLAEAAAMEDGEDDAIRRTVRSLVSGD